MARTLTKRTRARAYAAYKLIAQEGLTQEEAGERIGETRAWVAKYAPAAEAEMLAEMRRSIEGAKLRQALALRKIHCEALAAWVRSQQDAQTVKTTKAGNGGEKSEITTRGQSGDPRFLQAALTALGDERNIWGLNAAHKIVFDESRMQDAALEFLDRALAEVPEEYHEPFLKALAEG